MKTSIKEKDLAYDKEGNVIGEIIEGRIIKQLPTPTSMGV